MLKHIYELNIDSGKSSQLTNTEGVEITNATTFSTTYNAADKAAINLILNRKST